MTHDVYANPGIAEQAVSTADSNGPSSADARVGYQVAVAIWTNLGVELWARHNSMLLANSILSLVAAGLLVNDKIFHWAMAPAAGGILLCGVWFLMLRRALSHRDYYILSARELEDKFLTSVQTVSRSSKISAGSEVEIQDRIFRLDKYGRILQEGAGVGSVIIIFVLIYAALIFAAATRLP